MSYHITKIIIYSVLIVITNTIRVPTSWDLNGQTVNQFRTINTAAVGGSEIGDLKSLPYGVQFNNKVNHNRRAQENERHNNLKTIFHDAENNDWIPIVPNIEQLQQQSRYFPTNVQPATGFPLEQLIYTTQQPDWLPNFEEFTTRTTPTFENLAQKPLTINKNPKFYTTHEPIVQPTKNLRLRTTTRPHPARYQTTVRMPAPKLKTSARGPALRYNKNPKIQEQRLVKSDSRNNLQYSHENPPEVPTRPIYPGEGKWAKPGIKHWPHISPHKFAFTPEAKNTQTADGYHVFIENQKLFDKEKSKFRENIDEFPQIHFKTHSKIREHTTEAAIEEDDEEPEFTPTKLYAQVRRSESTEHLPKDGDDPRLKEVVRDSKIQTVYTEEGYEDSAYDHAGQEKNAEQDEGYAEFNKDIETEKLPKTSKIQDSEPAGSDYQIKKPTVTKNQKKDMIATKETKTMAVKAKDDGQDEMEIVSEIKVLIAPNNSTKTHKYIKIIPKYSSINITPKSQLTTKLPQLSKSTQNPQTLKIENSTIDSNKTDQKNTVNRVKRSIDNKYPYYNNPSINKNSPLRYSENLATIPPKTDDELAFYHQADRVECAEVEDNVDPIPDRIKNAEEEGESDDVQELAKSPRLGKLGDKIDCFKIKYFGENPLDNPFFEEKTVAPVLSIFKNFPPATTTEKIHTEVEAESSDLINKHKTADWPNLLTSVKKVSGSPVISHLPEPKVKSSNASLFKRRIIAQSSAQEAPIDIMAKSTENPFFKPLVSHIIANPNLKNEIISLPPKVFIEVNKPPSNQQQSIGFDSPIVVATEAEEDTIKKIEENILTDVIKQLGVTTIATPPLPIPSSPPLPSQILNSPQNITETPTISIITTPSYTIDLQPKHIYDQIELLQYLPIVIPSENNNINTVNTTIVRQAKSLEQNSTTINEVSTSTTETLPTSLPLQQRINRRRLRPRRPPFQIFDVTRFLPNQPSYFEKYPIISTPPPRVVRHHSEVAYKNDIRPEEQLNVLTDVINIIKNSTEAPVKTPQSYINFNRKKQPASKLTLKNSELGLDDYQNTRHNYWGSSTTMTPIVAPTNRVKHSSHRMNDQLYRDLIHNNHVQYDMIELLKIEAARTSTPQSVVDEDVTRLDEEDSSQVLGLVPPAPELYTTIYQKDQDTAASSNKPLNYFLVDGMKPPLYSQKVLLYSDFKTKPKLKRRRFRRSPARGYTEVSRNRNKPIDVDDEEEVIPTPADDDDYVPHRPKNYHYDENLGRIVYDKNPEAVTEAEEEYIEITEAPLPKPTRRNQITTPKFNEAFEGPSYVEYIKQLKANPKYVPIPDPTTTEKPIEEPTSPTTTPKPISTTPPEFLGILAKIRSDPNYKPIEDKNKTKSTTTTESVEIIEEEEEEEEETPQRNVQNSPGGGQNFASNFQIFDITEYLPKVKNYSPRTSIDTSKYKTIERPNLRHNLSSKYSEEEMEEIRSRNRENLSESKQDNEEPMKSTSNTLVEKTIRRRPTTSSIEESTENLLTQKNRGRPSAENVENHRKQEAEVATQRSRVRTRVRPSLRTTTTRTLSTSTESVILEPAIHPKSRRVYPRRRPTRIKIPTTTEESDETTKIVHRRHQPYNEEEIDDNSEKPVDEIERQPKKIAETSSKTNESSEVVQKIPSNVEVFQQYDKTKKHGGNYHRENDEAEDTIVADQNEEEVKRLTDIVPKPSSFYTDPKLPKNINRLMEVDTSSIEDDIHSSENVEDEEEISEKADDYLEYEIDNHEGEIDEEKKFVTTKKPIFVKDPGKRLYYYAPV